MTVSILVATPHPAFGELIRSSLEESGKYRVHVSLSTREARASSLHGVFQVAILDSALSDEPFIPLCYDLLDQQKGLRLVVVPPENNPNHPALGGLMPHGYLSRPFYLPDLLETVARLLEERSVSPAGAGVNGQAPGTNHANKAGVFSYSLPDWLTDPRVLSAYLDQQLPTTQALAGLVGISDVTPGSGILHASAGKLNPAAAQEMTNMVFRYWNRSKKADLMRFVRLGCEKQDFLIYATPLAGELVLTLIYDTDSPLSQVRPQTKELAQMLATEPPGGFHSAAQDSGDAPEAGPALAETLDESGPKFAGSTAADNQPASVPPGAGKEEPVGDAPGSREGSIPEPGQFAAQEPDTQPIEDMTPFESNTRAVLQESPAPQPDLSDFDSEEGGDEESSMINLSALLGTIPMPDPGTETAETFNAGWLTGATSINPRPQPGFNGWQPITGFDLDTPDDQPTAPPQKETPPAAFPEGVANQNEPIPDWILNPPEDGAPEEAVGDEAPLSNETEINIMPSSPAEEPPAVGEIVLGVEPPIDPLEDTRPRVLSAISSINQLEPVSPAISLLNYTCVLVPRLPQHYLTGELADRLSHWVQQLCLAFGWRLEGISVRPEYLQWTLQVAPSVSPGNLVRIIRQRTSINIFNHFSNLAEQNPSGDFWAVGYLIVSGSQPPSAQLLRDYILQTRKRQGIGR